DLIEIDPEAVSWTPVAAVDPALGLVALDKIPESPRSRVTGEAARRAWQSGLASGRFALAHQLVGASSALLQLATEYALSRSQFGVKIGTFQAVRHRLADVRVAVDAAAAATVAAGTAPGCTSAALAKALAGRAAALAGKNCLQVFGGIGFSSEHTFHRYF